MTSRRESDAEQERCIRVKVLDARKKTIRAQTTTVALCYEVMMHATHGAHRVGSVGMMAQLWYLLDKRSATALFRHPVHP